MSMTRRGEICAGTLSVVRHSDEYKMGNNPPALSNLSMSISEYRLSYFDTVDCELSYVKEETKVTMAECITIQVVSGDSCGSLAVRCGITAAQFTEYNPSPTLCSTLAVGEHVCCSSGSLPDYSPQPYANGTCYTYTVQSGDYCDEIAAEYSITVDLIDTYNNQTWGWLGCSDLQADQNICLSTGNPPFPAPVNNAVCGPQVPGTQPGDISSWELLNPCPLNACCDIWGQCGTTPEFCTATVSSTGNPGTAATGTNGCISNCGTDIVNNSTGPEIYASVGYFEGFNTQRPCLVMNASDIDPFKYTHIHYAFGNITSDFDVNDGGYNDQFNDFLALEDVYRVITFGGWAFSTDPLTYMIFRDGTTANNRQTFAQNVVNFVNLYNLDGVDFDWEYPGEPDIPGIPAGSADEGTNYLAFLQELRTLMPSNKTISVAAPASYWYLKQFPIKDIATVVDYIIFMTYDLQGIWDLNNSNAESGCPAGNCLRSDVNLTETLYSLSMITKAGVPANQVMVGVTSYGRSFLMATEGCYGPMCTYTEAGLAGDCTQTAGFISNAEINDIISNNPTAQTMQDSDSNTDILVYNDTQWVGYMSSDTKDSRAQLYQGLNFGGTSEWAIDLEEFEQPTTVVPIDPPCQTVTLSSYPATPDPTDLGTPINGTSYFSITHACFQDTNITNPKFANKAAFMTQAYKDATNLADSSQDWPTYGTDASDLYFGIDTQDSPYASDIAGTSFQCSDKYRSLE